VTGQDPRYSSRWNKSRLSLKTRDLGWGSLDWENMAIKGNWIFCLTLDIRVSYFYCMESLMREIPTVYLNI
jgi:hypothetical protein